MADVVVTVPKTFDWGEDDLPLGLAQPKGTPLVPFMPVEAQA